MSDTGTNTEQSASCVLDALPTPGEVHIARIGTDPLEALCGAERGGTAGPPGSRKITCAMCLILWEDGDGWRVPRYVPPDRSRRS